MRKLASAAVAVAILAMGATAGAQAKTSGQPQSSPAVKSTYDEIRKTFGFVPEFLRLAPEAGLPGAWKAMSGLQLNPDTAIPNKYKELIGLAVAAQIPCSYCTYFHTAAAKQNGAGEKEIKEALGMAALTRQWSTVINGSAQEASAFRAEIDKMFSSEAVGGTGAQPGEQQKGQGTQAGGPTAQSYLTVPATPEQTMKDVEATLGFVPGFVASVPKAALPGMWSEYKAVELNPNTAIPQKYKALIALAVASQIPCDYCVYADRKAALTAGAGEEEIAEAIGMAAITRHWSTLLNGSDFDTAKFRRDADRILKNAAQQQQGRGGSGKSRAPRDDR